MSRYAKPEHKRAARMLGYTLTLGTEAAWWQFAALMGVILSPKERAALAYMALSAQDDPDAFATAETALFFTRRAA